MATVRWLIIAALAGAAVYAFTLVTPAPLSPVVQNGSAEVWQCPMHPKIIQDHPGTCPVCHMDLVKVEQRDHSAGHEALPELATITLSEDRLQKSGVRTQTAVSGMLDETVHAVGVVTAAESRTVRVHARFSGWVEELHVRETGASVSKGDPLVRIYSPEVLAAQQEFVTALAGRGGDSLTLRLQSAAEERLRTLGVDAAPLRTLGEGERPTGMVTLRAPQGGFITQKEAIQGVYISPGTALFEVADLSTVWLLVDVRESDLARVRVDQKAQVGFPAFPGVTVDGKVSYLYPTLDPGTRTLRGRIELPNPGRRLRPGMFGTAELSVQSSRGVMVPADAVVQTGRNTYAFVARGEGVFEPRAVEAGARTGEMIQIRSGIAEGEAVVTGAIFLVDSESRLRATVERR